MSSLRWVKIAVILLSVSITLLLLRNSLISLYQSLNFVLSLLNYSGSGTILLGNPTYLFCSCTGAVNISFVYFILACKVSLVIFKDLSHSDNASILCF